MVCGNAGWFGASVCSGLGACAGGVWRRACVCQPDDHFGRSAKRVRFSVCRLTVCDQKYESSKHQLNRLGTPVFFKSGQLGSTRKRKGAEPCQLGANKSQIS